MSEKPPASQKSHTGLIFFFILLLAGGAAGALHYFGKLQPLIDRARGAVADARKAAPETAPVPARVEPARTAPASAPVAKEALKSAPVTVPPPEAGNSQMAAAYRARFKAPKAGSELTLTLKNGQKTTGIFEGLDDAGVRITSQKATITFSKAQLAPISVARCYPDEYVKYMTALDSARAAEEKAMEEQIARLKAEYEKQRQGQSSAMAGQKGNTSRARATKASDDGGDFKKWMEQNGESDLLKARKQRIAEYEAQRIAEGREY